MMGVYIKGVEIPKDGAHPYWVTIHSDGTVEYNENKGQGWQTSEAVPVPAHGRLIDADVFNDNATKLMDEFYINGEYAEERGANMLRHIAIEAPTIIPAEEATP